MPENTDINFIEDEKYSDWFAVDFPIYQCKFNKSAYRDSLFEKLGICFPSSLQKAVGKRRSEFLVGRYCAEKSLQKLGIFNSEIKIGANRNPLWPDTVVGSISHCGAYAVAIASNSPYLQGVGIDIEDEVEPSTIENIQRQILSEKEILLISKNADEIPFLFTLAFSLKESFFKAAYPLVGEYFDFDVISIAEIDQAKRAIKFHLNCTLHEKLPQGMVLSGAFHVLPEKQVVTLVLL